jgi:hypothetical protein
MCQKGNVPGGIIKVLAKCQFETSAMGNIISQKRQAELSSQDTMPWWNLQTKC